MSDVFVPRGRTSTHRRARSSADQDRVTNAEDTPIPDAEPLAADSAVGEARPPITNTVWTPISTR